MVKSSLRVSKIARMPGWGKKSPKNVKYAVRFRLMCHEHESVMGLLEAWAS